MPEYPLGFEPEQGGLHAFFGPLVDEGLSQNKAIAAFREAGGVGSNALLRGEYNFARDVAEAGEAGWGQTLDQPWVQADFIEWEAGVAGLAGYPVSLHVRGEGGEIDIVPHFVYGTDDMTPEDVFSQAISTYGAGTLDDPNYPQGDITSVSMRGAPFRMVGRAAA